MDNIVIENADRGNNNMENNNARPTWDEYFGSITKQVASRSTCLRRKVGAIIVKDKRILTTGYNGAPKGVKNCLERGKCLREEMGVPSGQRQEICRALHAEQNAIIQAAYHGVNIQGSVLYSTTQPCVQCAKMIINSGIRKIYYFVDYPDELSLELLNEAGVELIRLTEEKL
jgi:dCMP deaminase